GTLRKQHRDALVLVAPGVVAKALIADVWREQSEHAVALQCSHERTKAYSLDDDVALRVRHDRFLDLISAARAGVDQPIARHTGAFPPAGRSGPRRSGAGHPRGGTACRPRRA